jgi:hypothetical protein
MKLQTILRMQAITIGLGAALFLATAAPAQEIDNTIWADDSSAAAKSASAPAAASNDLNMTAASAQVVPTPVEQSSVVTDQASLSEVVPANRWGIVFLLVCLAVVGWYVRETARRAERKQPIEWKKL